MWLVVLTKYPSDFPYPPDDWPRKFKNKRDALWAIELINRSGGEADLSFDETLARPVFSAARPER